MPLPLPISPHEQRRGRGRPKGSGNRRSLDLAKYIEATFGGMTPGQQAAQLSMVTPAELKRAKADAAELQILDRGLSNLQLAQVVKAWKLARAIGCETRDAYLLMAKEREALMPYVHQKLPTKEPPKADETLPMVILMGDGPDEGRAIDGTDADPDRIEFVGEILGDADEVGN